MKIFLSSLEQSSGCSAEGSVPVVDLIDEPLKWNLMSFYYLRKTPAIAEKVFNRSEQILIDSGAHSFQKGAKVDFDSFVEEYREYIKKTDNEKILGYFEMDVDGVIGYSKVLEYREYLETATDKIIPVWHRGRGIEEYKKMCKDYSGRIVAITGFQNEDIKDHQYLMFLKYAREQGCKVHCLGMTRKRILDRVPFDFVDSSSWAHQAIYGRLYGQKVTRETTSQHMGLLKAECYKEGMRMQEHYYEKWRNVCND